MCGQIRFDVRDNVATFDGRVEVCCLPLMGLAPAPGDSVADQLRTHMTGLLRAFLQHLEYQTGEGRVTVRGPVGGVFGDYRIQASIFAEGPDQELHMPTYTWADAIRRSAGS